MNAAAMRARAGQRLTATGAATRASAGAGAPYLNEDDEVVYPGETGDTIWTGPCSVAPQSNRGREDVRGGRQIEGRQWVVAVPVDGTGGIRLGDTFTVTAVDADHGDPALVGIAMTVEEVIVRSRSVLRRLLCTDTAGTTAELP